MKRLLMIFMLLMLVLPTAGVLAREDEETDAGIKTYSIQIFGEPQSIKLPRAATSYWFQVPPGTEIREAALKLVLDTSDTLLEDYSTATVEINGVAVGSINLQNFKTSGKECWTIDIAADRLKADGSVNQISIITSHRSILGDSADIDNPANWLIISDKSSLTLKLREAENYLLSNLYPAMFDRVEDGNQMNLAFELAGRDKDAEAEAVFTVASAAGANYPYKALSGFEVNTGEDKAEGRRFQLDADAGIPDGTGRLSVGTGDALTVRAEGGGAEGLRKAARVLSDPELLGQFTADSAEISSILDRHSVNLHAREDGYYTLEDFGYKDLNLQGAFHQQTSFSVRQPDGLLGGENSYFEVHFRHSDALISDTSLLTIYFDGVPASSIQLSRMNVDGGKLRVSIPKETLTKGSFEIGIDVYNYLGKIDASKDWYDVAWTVIGGDSILYLEPGRKTVVPSLSRFPSQWGDSTLICLPQDSSDTLIRAMGMLAVRNSQNTRAAVDYRVAHSLTAEHPDDNLILAGARDRIILSDGIKDELYVLPDGDGYRVKDGVPTIAEALTGKIIFQAVQSPYNFKKTAYVIMWDDDSMESVLAELCGSTSFLNSLSGELAIADLSGAVSVSAAESVEKQIPLSPSVVIDRAVRRTGISRIGLIIIGALAVVVILLIIQQSRVRNRFSKARASMQAKNGEDVNAAAQPKPADPSDGKAESPAPAETAAAVPAADTSGSAPSAEATSKPQPDASDGSGKDEKDSSKPQTIVSDNSGADKEGVLEPQTTASDDSGADKEGALEPQTIASDDSDADKEGAQEPQTASDADKKDALEPQTVLSDDSDADKEGALEPQTVTSGAASDDSDACEENAAKSQSAAPDNAGTDEELEPQPVPSAESGSESVQGSCGTIAASNKRRRRMGMRREKAAQAPEMTEPVNPAQSKSSGTAESADLKQAESDTCCEQGSAADSASAESLEAVQHADQAGTPLAETDDQENHINPADVIVTEVIETDDLGEDTAALKDTAGDDPDVSDENNSFVYDYAESGMNIEPGSTGNTVDAGTERSSVKNSTAVYKAKRKGQ